MAFTKVEKLKFELVQGDSTTLEISLKNSCIFQICGWTSLSIELQNAFNLRKSGVLICLSKDPATAFHVAITNGFVTGFMTIIIQPDIIYRLNSKAKTTKTIMLINYIKFFVIVELKH
jgi:hypothetical protein